MSINHSRDDLCLPVPSGDVWVFGYGSLMWDPGFEFDESHKAIIKDYHRSFCIWSVHYRGTFENPGLVVGLDTGGECVGRAYRITEEQLYPTLSYLKQREMDTGVYIPSIRPIWLDTGVCVDSLVFIADHKHDHYAGKLPVEEKVKIIKRARGGRGLNIDYVINTYEHLLDSGIDDTYLKSVVDKL